MRRARFRRYYRAHQASGFGAADRNKPVDATNLVVAGAIPRDRAVVFAGARPGSNASQAKRHYGRDYSPPAAKFAICKQESLLCIEA